MLQFSPPNAKLRGLASVRMFLAQQADMYAHVAKGKTYSFDLPAGYACPGARECKSRAVETPEGWRIKDGKDCRFRCYSASQECVLPPVRNMRQRNLSALKRLRSRGAIARRLTLDMPSDTAIVRLHSSGDFYARHYLGAWLDVARTFPTVLFYGYTKCLHFWSAVRDKVSALHNFRLVASYGGRWDHLIEEYNFPSCRVVYSVEEAERLGLPIDHDDTHAAGFHGDVDFCILIHGTQPQGSEEAKAVYRLRKKGLNGYRRDKRGYGLKKDRRNRKRALATVG